MPADPHFTLLFAPLVVLSQQKSATEASDALTAFNSSDNSASFAAIPVLPRMDSSAATAKPMKHSVESELIIEGLASYGNWEIFAAGTDCKMYTAGIEYNRHSWGHVIGARVDYVAEFLPLVLLKEPASADFWGYPETTARKIVPGIGISPIGVRFQWLSRGKIKPYLEVKGGILGFTQKVLSPVATYENFSFQSAIGAQVKLSDRWGLRLGAFSDFHFSNAFITASNPGLDVMNANLGLSYHFR
jgi:hypothetical protein